MRMARSHLWVGFLAVAACGGRHDAPQLVIPLSTLADELGIGFQLTLNGETAWFVVDTGAGAHMFARWFVERAALPVDSSFADLSATDATGTVVHVHVVPGLAGRLESGHSLALGAAVVAQFPPFFESAQAGGALNPQLSASEASAVVLDLRVPEMRIEPFDRAVRRLGATILGEDDVEVCVVTAAPVPNKLFAIRVRVGEREGWLQLDTGADATSITQGSALVDGLALEPGGTTMGLAGQPREYSLARDVVLTFAGHSVATSAHVVERVGPTCGSDGLLGLDAVGRCALIMGSQAVAIACTPAREGLPKARG
jgi:hypothetical protein